MKRIILFLAVMAIVVTMVFGVGMASADVPEGGGCKRLIQAAEQSENQQAVETALFYGCPPRSPQTPEADPPPGA